MCEINYMVVVRDLLRTEVQQKEGYNHEEVMICNRIAEVLGWHGPKTISSSLLNHSKRDPKILNRAFKRHHVTVI